jgi:predicted regulator of Ras-like GTPase activity (Roadblock/LC7/MglB family)
MSQQILEKVVEDIPSLRATFITAMPDCLLFAAWQSRDVEMAVEDVAAYFGDLVRSNRQGLKALGAWSSEMQITIESADSLIILREVNADFVFGAIFERTAALGMLRLHLRRMLDRVNAILPKATSEERPRGVRIVEFLDRYAPDPHAVLLRASLRTGVSLEALQNAERLSDEQVAKLEEAACRILGLKELNL